MILSILADFALKRSLMIKSARRIQRGKNETSLYAGVVWSSFSDKVDGTQVYCRGSYSSFRLCLARELGVASVRARRSIWTRDGEDTSFFYEAGEY